jgi:hypothetical protein
MTDQHKIVLYGPAASADRISAHMFRDLLDVLVEGAERALRFRIEGRSTARGTPPAWLRPASDFDLIRAPHVGVATALIEAKPLISTMPDRFRQGDVFADLDPRQSAIELFERALGEVARTAEGPCRR